MFEISHRLAHRLARIYPLTEAERHALANLQLVTRIVGPHQDIAHEGERPGYCCLIVDGWACRYKTLHEGKRQILSFHIPGDLPDLQSLHLEVTDHSLAALTPVTAGFVSHSQIHGLIEEHPRLGSALWKYTLIDAAIYREWIVGMGRKEALPRMAHLLCEVFLRMRSAGLTIDRRCPLPITQIDMSDALGLTTVHVSRVLRELRQQELIVLDQRMLTILDWPELMATAEFDPTYLHQEPRVDLNPV